jgi:hypothetical protein
MDIQVLLALIWMHFVADFILQSDWMAVNKSKRTAPLLAHVSVYSAPLLVFGWQFAMVNGAAHLITDWVSARATSRLWAAGERHWFFVVIGLDQAVHMSTLVLTYVVLVG